MGLASKLAGGNRTATPPLTQVPSSARMLLTNEVQLCGKLTQCVADQNIGYFYNAHQLCDLARRHAASGQLDALAIQWKLDPKVAIDLVKASLFDWVFYIDDSGSVKHEEDGQRVKDLKDILTRVATVASIFDADGITIRFFNSDIRGDNISTPHQALALIDKLKWDGLTPLGEQLEKKILKPMLLEPAKKGTLKKPVVVVVITDGVPYPERPSKIVDVIKDANKKLSKTKYGADAVSYQFAQLGKDSSAQQFLASLDNHPEIGGLIDSISYFEAEQDEVLRKSNGKVHLTPQEWLLKLLMGPIDSSYDQKD